ncbi:MAG: hypothetical protein UZ18_ATM001001297 [Armatimonadetes bacterium OLB18]|nr:MAG: hypothetical protein UZ18_ATM001001297 [Armatimonadetes bacterium OLB18]
MLVVRSARDADARGRKHLLGQSLGNFDELGCDCSTFHIRFLHWRRGSWVLFVRSGCCPGGQNCADDELEGASPAEQDICRPGVLLLG